MAAIAENPAALHAEIIRLRRALSELLAAGERLLASSTIEARAVMMGPEPALVCVRLHDETAERALWSACYAAQQELGR